MAQPPPRKIGSYVCDRTLGHGTTGKVKLAHHETTHVPVAIKIINKAAFDSAPDRQLQIHREIALLRVVRHPNIVALLDVYESPHRLCLVLEYAGHGPLFGVLEQGYLPEERAMDYFRQIVLGLEYLHSLGICHRDLKAENILLDKHDQIKIADFGFARWVHQDLTRTPCGSPHYTAPEILSGGEYDGRRADIWSLGVLVYALLTGSLPFNDPDIRSLIQKIRRGVFGMPPFPPDLAELVRMLLVVSPVQRATIADIKAHSTFRIGLPLVDYVLPSPVPFARYSSPMELSSVSDEVRGLLRRIGYENDAELAAELASAAHTMAKVFVGLLTRQLDVEELPWDEAVGGSPGALLAGPFMTDYGGGDEQSPSFSVEGRPDWYASPVDAAAVIEAVALSAESAWRAMAAGQAAAGTLGMQFFHPDPLNLYLRGGDGITYVSAHAVFTEENRVELEIKLHKGSSEMFEDFRRAVAAALAESVPADDDDDGDVF